MTPQEKRKATMLEKYGSDEAMKAAMAEWGKKGGVKKGDTKRRGGKEYYSKLGKLGSSKRYGNSQK